MSSLDTVPGSDGRPRCRWCAAAPEFEDYHDLEWGFPVADDLRLFEKLCLESFQSGLSWRTILVKRDNFRRAFAGFDFHRMARYDTTDIERLLQDAGIVRHRGKIEAVIHNAGCAARLQAERGSLAAYFWQFETNPASRAPAQSASVSPDSIALSLRATWTRVTKRSSRSMTSPAASLSAALAFAAIEASTTRSTTRSVSRGT